MKNSVFLREDISVRSVDLSTCLQKPMHIKEQKSEVCFPLHNIRVLPLPSPPLRKYYDNEDESLDQSSFAYTYFRHADSLLQPPRLLV